MYDRPFLFNAYFRSLYKKMCNLHKELIDTIGRNPAHLSFLLFIFYQIKYWRSNSFNPAHGQTEQEELKQRFYKGRCEEDILFALIVVPAEIWHIVEHISCFSWWAVNLAPIEYVDMCFISKRDLEILLHSCHFGNKWDQSKR